MSQPRPRTTQGVRKRVHTRKDGSTSIRYYARFSYRDGSGERVFDTSPGFCTKREAEAEYVRMRAARESGTYTSPTSMTVTEFIEGHWLPSIETRVKATTFDNYRRMWTRHIKPETGWSAPPAPHAPPDRCPVRQAGH